jgi:hypothetical protein
VNREQPEYKPAYPPLLIWGAFLSVLTGVGVICFDPGAPMPALLGGSAACVLVLGLLLGITRRSVQVEGGGTDPDGSPATVWLALSLALAVLGAALGPWLAFIGGGMSLVGVAAVVRELRAQRAAARAAIPNHGLGMATGAEGEAQR